MGFRVWGFRVWGLGLLQCNCSSGKSAADMPKTTRTNQASGATPHAPMVASADDVLAKRANTPMRRRDDLG